MRHSVNQSGFTLIELMIVIAIIGIIAGMAYPSMQKQIATMRLKNAVNMTESMLKQARVEALTTRQNITVRIGGNPAALMVTRQPNMQFDSNIIVTQQNRGSIVITAQKEAKSSNSTATRVAPIPEYSFCYKNTASDKYTVKIDRMTNVKVETIPGGCS
ncbi:Tfp pilus assembly protein FimT/FimU [Moraxella boevrei]|uniref:pilus assembly FimT family protein n=1 Tax=Faucicola boevrei TaxID=346665 RepID=UPI00373534FB